MLTSFTYICLDQKYKINIQKKILNMNSYKNYIDLLRNILKTFDDEFDNVIKKILSKIFDEYYMNRNNEIYCLDNLYKKYNLSRYNHMKKKYGVVKNSKLIFRFNRYSKKIILLNY